MERLELRGTVFVGKIFEGFPSLTNLTDLKDT